MREWDPQKGLLYNSVWGAKGGFFFNYFHILTLCSADTLEHDFISPIIFTHLAQAKPWHKIILQMCWPRVHISPFIWVTQTDRESLVMKSCIIAFTQSRSKRRRNQFHFRKFSWLATVKQNVLIFTNQLVASEIEAVTSSTWGIWTEGLNDLFFLFPPEWQHIPDIQTLCCLMLRNPPAVTVWSLKADLGFRYPHSCHSPQTHYAVKRS